MSPGRRIGNAVVSSVLRSRAHRLLSGSLILLGFRGRKSGREYAIPVGYAGDDEGLIVFAARAARKTWWRNVDDRPVQVRLRGTDYDATAHVVRGRSLASHYLAGHPRAADAVAAEDDPVFVRIDYLCSHGEPISSRIRRDS